MSQISDIYTNIPIFRKQNPHMALKKILLVGSTGLVGQTVLNLALQDPRVSQVIALSRRPLLEQPRLLNPIVNFDLLPTDASWWDVDAVICTLGTTIKKAGSQEAFRQVDYDYPLNIAKLAKKYGVAAFVLNSAAGANAESSIFYTRTKGEVEQAISELDFPSLTIVRPSLIGGDRQEFRAGEQVALLAFKLLNPLIPAKYRTVHADKIATCLLNAAINAPIGKQIVESEKI